MEFGNWEQEHGTRNKKEGIGKVGIRIRVDREMKWE